MAGSRVLHVQFEKPIVFSEWEKSYYGKRFQEPKPSLYRFVLKTDPDFPERDEAQEDAWAQMISELIWNLSSSGKDLYYYNPLGIPHKDVKFPRQDTVARGGWFSRWKKTYVRFRTGQTPPEEIARLSRLHISYDFEDYFLIVPHHQGSWAEALQRVTQQEVIDLAVLLSVSEGVCTFGCEEMVAQFYGEHEAFRQHIEQALLSIPMQQSFQLVR